MALTITMVLIGDGYGTSEGLEVLSPLGRFWRERSEMGLVVVPLEGLGGELMLKHLALSMAIVDMLAIGVCFGAGNWFTIREFWKDMLLGLGEQMFCDRLEKGVQWECVF